MRQHYSPHHVLGQDVYLRTRTDYNPSGQYKHEAALVSGHTVLFCQSTYGNATRPCTMQDCIILLWKNVDDFIGAASAQIISAGLAENERIEGGLAADLSPGPGDTQ